MEAPSLIVSILLSMTLLVGWGAPGASDLFDVDTQQLAALWQKEHLSPSNPYSLKHAQLTQRLQGFAQEYPGFIRVEKIGASVEGREIDLVTLGAGTRKILFWSQMHGNEPTATCSLIDLFQFFARHRDEPWVAEILSRYQLLFIPMLNPDGAERDDRRNSQGIDINRDARVLQTPEGMLLKQVRDRFEPFLGFNLHNQNGLTTVGDTGKVATIALLAVAADAPGAVIPSPSPEVPDDLAKRITAVLYEALSPFVYGHISRYDDPFNPRAFGDMLTLKGTPIVLIESGGLPAGAPANLTVELNFVGILATLNSLATGRIKNANPAVFDALKLNSSNPIYDLMLTNAWIFTGTGIPLFRGDVGIRADMRGGSGGNAIIAELGDLGIFSAHRTMDCTGTLLTPGLIAWDPERSLFTPGRNGQEYLRRGILTLIETASWREIQGVEPAPDRWAGAQGPDWGFVVAGEPPREDEKAELRLASWLAAGARGWIPDSSESAARLPRMRQVAAWFRTDITPRTDAMKYQIPIDWSGDPARILTRWTSEAARTFRLSGRGVITSGSRADLVIWRTPEKIIFNGRLIDLAQPEPGIQGRFLGRM